MLYEGSVEVYDSMVSIDLAPQGVGSDYSMTFDDNPDLFTKTMGHLKPFFDPDEEPESTDNYVDRLRKQGFGTFYSDSQNIHDLINLYSHTPPAKLNSFPGLGSPRGSNEVVFTETIKNFSGMINGKIVEKKTIQFQYRGEL